MTQLPLRLVFRLLRLIFSIFDGDEEWYYHSAKDFSVDFTDGSILSCVWNHCKYVTSAGEVLFECDTYNIRPESYILDLSDNPVTVASFTNIDQDMSRRETYDDVFTTNIGPLLNNIIFSKGEYSNGDIYADGSIYSNNEKLATESYIDEKVKNLPTSEEVVKHHNATAGRYAYIGESGTDRTMYIHEQLNKERLGYAHLPCRKYGGQVEVANAVNDCDAVNMQVLQHYLDQIATALGIELIAHPQETTIPTRNN